MRDPALPPSPVLQARAELRARELEFNDSVRYLDRALAANEMSRRQEQHMGLDARSREALAMRATAETEYRQRLAAVAQHIRLVNGSHPSTSHYVGSSSSSHHHYHQHHHQQQQQQPQHLPSLHRVYVIRCASCDAFLSDRGMRAVLLLKPNIVLFSTDGAPVNASPIWSGPDTDDEGSERTCECLTSSLSCHGCGNVIGYHIVSPCQRCTASVARHQRTANHHRYVFHHNEVRASERKYFEGEDGVVGPRLPLVVQPSSAGHPVSPTPPADSQVPSAPGTPVQRSEHCETKDMPLQPPARQPSPTRSDDLSRSAATPQQYVPLKTGDTLYWHNLVLGGERPVPTDPRSRDAPISQRLGR